MKLIDNLLFVSVNETTFMEGMWEGYICVVIALYLLCVALPLDIEKENRMKAEDEERSKDRLRDARWEREVNKAKREHPEWFD